MSKPILLFIIDGLGDRPVTSLGGLTPLEAATTPHLDALASAGQLGRLQIIDRSPNEYTSSESGHFSLFGYEHDSLPGRGVLEALGLGLSVSPGALYLRTNFASWQNDLITDRRAGRITDRTAELCTALSLSISGYRFRLFPGVKHRAVLEIQGPNLSSQISSNDSKQEQAPPLPIKALQDSLEAKSTASVLSQYLDQAATILKDQPLNQERVKAGQPPANYLLVRGASLAQPIDGFYQKYHLKGAAVARGLYLGIAKYLGLSIFEWGPEKGEDIGMRFTAAAQALKNFDFVFLHLKQVDEYGHDGLCQEKKAYLEKIDQHLLELGDLSSVVVAVTADHATPCELKSHSSDPVPLLVTGGTASQIPNKFGETACANGPLGTKPGVELMPLLIKLSGR